jgi:hypothetical protein
MSILWRVLGDADTEFFPFTAAWRVLRLRMEFDGLQIYIADVNYTQKAHSWTTEKG